MVNKLLISVFLLYDGFMIAQNQPVIGFPSNHFTQFTTADGLPGNVIDAFDIDQQGFMWLATNNGLGRYDGQRFTPFKDLVAQSTLPDKAIRYVFADSHGHLWLRFLFDGTYRIDLNTYKVTHLTDSFWTIDPNYLPSCLEDKAGNVWLSVTKGLVKYTHKTNAFTFYPNQDSTTRSIISLCEGDDNYCWVVSRGGLFRFDFQSHRFEREQSRRFRKRARLRPSRTERSRRDARRESSKGILI